MNNNYINMEKKQNEINQLYHDIGNHIETIQVLIANDDIEKARQYTKDLVESYRNIKKYSVCDNKIVNAVLSQKLKHCDENDIATNMDIHIPKEVPIQDIDLMSLLSNLVDNAIECCHRNNRKYNFIHISMRCVGDYLAIKIVNSKEIKSANNKGYKLWNDKKIQGYGLKIVDSVVKKYNGQKEIKDLGNEFSAMVLLSLNN